MIENNEHFIINEPTVVHENIDGETVILNLDTGNYYSVVDVGGDIWGFIAIGKTVSDIVTGIQGKYDCSDGDEKTILLFLEQLQQEGLIITDNGNKEASVPEVSIAGNRAEERKQDFQPPVLNKYTDMQDLLLLDPIHEVDATGWPSIKGDK